MKNKLLVMVSAIVFLSAYFASDGDHAFASCGFSYPHLYWPYTPCHDAGESIDEQKQGWANFYYFMGPEWMEQKTTEYETLLHDSSLEEPYLKWVGDGPNYNVMHYNFAQYYNLFGGDPPVITDLKPIEIPQQDQYLCDDNCLERLEKKGKYMCHQESAGDYLCVMQSHVWTQISSTQTEFGQQTIFKPSEVTLSLGINNTIGWRNHGYVSSIASNSAMFAPIQVPFTDLSWLLIDKPGEYEFYDHTDPNVRVKVTVVPFDYNFEIGKPIEKSTLNPNVRYMVFRAPDVYNFVNGLQIIDQNNVNVFLDNTMNPEYAVNDFLVTSDEKQVSIGQKIVVGCTYHHDLYSRLFYLTLDNIDSQNKFAEFKETTEFVSGNRCFDDDYGGLMDSDKLNKIQQDPSVSQGLLKHGSTEIKSPLKQIKLGITLDQIQCKESLTLMTKDGKRPACVTPSTASELDNRGWSWVLDVEPLSSATMTLPELCATEFDKIMDSVKRSCGLPDSNVVCSPPTLMGSLMNAEKNYTDKFAEHNCARIIDEWSDFSPHRNAFGGSEIDWKLLADIYDENPVYAISGLDEKFQPNKVGQKIRMTINYWDTVSCFDYKVRIIDKTTEDVVYDQLYSYDCKPGEVGQYGKMNLKLFRNLDFKIPLPGIYFLEVSSDTLNLREEFFVECTSGGCEFLTDEQLKGRQTYRYD